MFFLKFAYNLYNRYIYYLPSYKYFTNSPLNLKISKLFQIDCFKEVIENGKPLMKSSEKVDVTF